jgi:hypothetical protein
MTTTYTIRKPYHAGQNIIINDFDQDGEIMITFFPTKQVPYIETDEYLNDPVIFTATNWTESKAFLDSIKSS